MVESTDELYSAAEKRLRQERDRAVEKIKEELKVAQRKALSK
jgi:LPS O-antigen subunit length determinant protein (WzzB/FepE family)